MPNHFHLHVRPKNTDVIPRLMKQLSNAYTKYFNTRYERVGGLFQGRYKTGEIENDEQNIHLHRYILINPLVSCLAESLEEYPWTSFYRKNVSRLNELCNDEEFRSRFSSLEDYKKFIYDQVDYSKSLHELKNLVVED
ncbi:transposase [Candidatus Collierbacteria bacterium]|nr:transposase [Candidatus Collierbacteria bacterium]